MTKAQKVLVVDEASAEGDWTAEVDVQANADGSITVLDMRRYKETIELSAAEPVQPRHFAFMKDIEGKWMVVIVRQIPGTATAEVTDFAQFPTKAAADAWRIERIGDGEVVFGRNAIN